MEQRPGVDGISNTVHPGPSVAVGSSTGGPDLSRTERPGTRSSSSSTSRQASAPDDESTMLRARRRGSGSEPSAGIEDPSWDGRKRPPWGGGLHLKDRDRHAARGDGQDQALGRRTASPSCSAVAVAVAVENAAAWCLWGMGTATPRRTWPETGMLSGLPASKLSIAVRDGQAGSCYATAGRLFPLPWLAAASSLRRPSP